MATLATPYLLAYSLAEGELHAAIDRLDALQPHARGQLKALGTALLIERRTATLTISGKEANAFLRKGRVPDDEQMELSLFKGVEHSICWSLSDLALGWDHTDEGQQGGVFYWSGASIHTRSADFDVAKDMLSDEFNGGGWLWEQWIPRAGGTVPYRRDGHLDQYLDRVSTVHEHAPGSGDNGPAPRTTTSEQPAPRRTRRRGASQ